MTPRPQLRPARWACCALAEDLFTSTGGMISARFTRCAMAKSSRGCHPYRDTYHCIVRRAIDDAAMRAARRHHVDDGRLVRHDGCACARPRVIIVCAARRWRPDSSRCGARPSPAASPRSRQFKRSGHLTPEQPGLGSVGPPRAGLSPRRRYLISSAGRLWRLARICRRQFWLRLSPNENALEAAADSASRSALLPHLPPRERADADARPCFRAPVSRLYFIHHAPAALPVGWRTPRHLCVGDASCWRLPTALSNKAAITPDGCAALISTWYLRAVGASSRRHHHRRGINR